ncbi:MAG: hypothetical protein LBL92_03980 [Propionibacteriaceae bacterium]|nr:hypothetical protein [Propionibacteriaceae bacterium]
MSDISLILADLAAGRIDSAEAERRIRDSDAETTASPSAGEASGEWSAPADSSAEPPPRSAWEPPSQTRARPGKAKAIERVIVKATGRRVKIVADPSVKTAMAEDIHQTRRRADSLEISGEAEQLSTVSSAIGFIRSIRGLDDIRGLGLGQELSVHVNPELEVDLEITGGSVTTTGVPRLGQVRLTAGVATLTEVSHLDDLVLQVGQVTVGGRFWDGQTRLRVESGQLTLLVAPDSEATIQAHSRGTGRVSWDTSLEHSETELVIGSGQAQIDVGVIIGQATIRVTDNAQPEE